MILDTAAAAAYALEQEILSKIEREPEAVDGKRDWYCTVCGHQGKKGHLIEHVEAKHVVHPGYQCQLCPKVCSNRNTLRKHKHDKHKNERDSAALVAAIVISDVKSAR